MRSREARGGRGEGGGRDSGLKSNLSHTQSCVCQLHMEVLCVFRSRIACRNLPYLLTSCVVSGASDFRPNVCFIARVSVENRLRCV